MNDLICLYHKFNPTPFWENPLHHTVIDENWEFLQSPDCVHLFDQNGYDLTPLEMMYAQFNAESFPRMHRNEHHYSIQKPWFYQPPKRCGYVINHALIFERKGYDGKALEQLMEMANHNPLIYKVIQIQPKWGIDLSIDYVDEEGSCFELLHYEHDSFNMEDAIESQKRVEELVRYTDFDAVAADLKSRRNEWMNLEFFEQSEWKCRYFGLPNERFKMVAWQ